MSERIHLSKADVTHVEEEFVLRALRSGWVAPLGPDVDAFESEVAERTGVAHALALSSGTAALHLALLHAGAGPGKVVVLPTMTFAASANAVAYTGAQPVFVDSQASDGNVNPTLLIEAVDVLRAEGKDIAAVMTVDLFGRCADYEHLEPALAVRDIPLLEDAAEAMGSSLWGRAAGSFGQVAALSFNGNKIMTTSGGGMLLSNDDAVIGRARYLATQARQPVPWYEHTEVGYNYRMSNVLAALGRGQLSRLDEMIARRKEIRQIYRTNLNEIPGVRLLEGDTQRGDSEDNAWLTVMMVERPNGPRPDDLIRHLGKRAIEARHVWKPMHLQESFASAPYFGGSVAQTLFTQGVTLPSGSALSQDAIYRVVSAVASLLK